MSGTRCRRKMGPWLVQTLPLSTAFLFPAATHENNTAWLSSPIYRHYRLNTSLVPTWTAKLYCLILVGGFNPSAQCEISKKRNVIGKITMFVHTMWGPQDSIQQEERKCCPVSWPIRRIITYCSTAGCCSLSVIFVLMSDSPVSKIWYNGLTAVHIWRPVVDALHNDT